MPPRLHAVPFTRVTLADGFWRPRQETNRTTTIPIGYEQCEKTGRLAAWKYDWKPGLPNQPHIFWDSDVGKWLEAAAYSLKTVPDAELEGRIDALVALMEKGQASDGYLNTHFQVVEPDKRWTNLRDSHELYCAGHLTEGAVAYFEATGKRAFLDVMGRYADHIGRTFGCGPGQKRGYCGHEEIELALVKLFRATGEKRHLDLAAYFIDERGQAAPRYFDVEARARGEDPARYWAGASYAYLQADKPVRQQDRVTGHAVRAMYLYCGMADVAVETGDASLIAALEKLWTHMSSKLLYVTGGIGSSRQNEGFTFDYDFPNETAYCETCASIALAFWAQRMLHLTGQGRFADVLERALYNATLSGVSLDGRKFFYANPLAVLPDASKGVGENVAAERQEWFGCSCCPTNIVRLLASAGQYFYSENDDTAFVHLYAQSDADLRLGGRRVRLQQRTRFPWAGKVALRVSPETPAEFALALRIPGWCGRFILSVNGKRLKPAVVDGYARITRTWRAGDTVRLELNMPVLQMEAHPNIRMNCGRVALQRGPLVYCLEEADNGTELNDLALPRRARFTTRFEKDLLGGVTALYTRATRRRPEAWADGTLYRPAPTPRRTVRIKAVPYCVWGNRSPGEMLVWLPRQD